MPFELKSKFRVCEESKVNTFFRVWVLRFRFIANMGFVVGRQHGTLSKIGGDEDNVEVTTRPTMSICRDCDWW